MHGTTCGRVLKWIWRRSLQVGWYSVKQISSNAHFILNIWVILTVVFNNNILLYIQWNLWNPTPEFSDILWHVTNIYGPKVFLLTKLKPEYSDILYIPTHFPGPMVCRTKHVPLYMIKEKAKYICVWHFFIFCLKMFYKK
jgi:hypothetical protein